MWPSSLVNERLRPPAVAAGFLEMGTTDTAPSLSLLVEAFPRLRPMPRFLPMDQSVGAR